VAVIGLGVDVVDVARAEALLVPRRRRALDRLLTKDELDYVSRMRYPARHLAVRLAAKEAVYKALQALGDARAVGWREIEVVRGDHGRPSVHLHGRAAQVLARRAGGRVHLSLTHSDLSAVAVAVLED
jgi:holo-[acyl-carrier protein] synthase